jgi:adenylate cyclase
MPLRIEVSGPGGRQEFIHPHGPIEFGRGPGRGVQRHVIDAPFVSRDQMRVEELATGLVRVANLSWTNAITLVGGDAIGLGQSRELPPPFGIQLRDVQVTVDRDGSAAEPLPAAPSPVSNRPASPVEASADQRAEAELGLVAVEALDKTLTGAGRSGTERLTLWLQTIVELQQAAPGSNEFFERTARAILDLVGMDLGMVLLARDNSWRIAASAVAGDEVPVRFSRTLVAYVAKSRRTFYQDLERLTREAASLLMVEAAVAAPIFGLHDEIAGVLYGVRGRGLTARGPINALEAQLVQLLAAAAGSNLARSMAIRTRVQFEQFFSPELVRELEQNPALLEGRSQEITLVFSDLRGFTRLSQRLGAEHTCRIVRDVMEHLSEQIVAQGGVIVDYAGDGILSMWNAPTEQPDHVVRACRAALAMLGEMPPINERWGREVGDALSLGIGINCGLAQVGNTGSSRKLKYGPHGYAVNLASRVQDATKRLGLPLLVTGAVRAHLPETMYTRRLGQVRLPGVEEPTVLYELQGERPSAEWVRRCETYEKGLALYEAGEWSRACQTVVPLLSSAADSQAHDIPTLKLLRRAWECLDAPPDRFEPVIEVGDR